MKIVKVVCGIVWKNGKILIARKRIDRPLGGYWEFPGGKVEENEKPVSALHRELNEELGMEICNPRYFDTHHYSDTEISIELIAFHADFKDATFALKDHDKIEFILPDKLLDYSIAPADRYFLDKLIH